MPASLITVADVIRGVEGPFSAGGDVAAAPSGGIGEVWAALRASERAVLESVTLADLAAGSLPEGIRSRIA